MTKIEFHFNARDKVHHTCRLLRKAVARHGTELVVLAEGATLDAIDAGLWDLSAVDFVPHCRSGDTTGMVRRSPVVLSETDAGVVNHRQVVVNVGSAVPPGFERFDRLIEIVSADAEDRQVARARWRYYADRGYDIASHDFADETA